MEQPTINVTPTNDTLIIRTGQADPVVVRDKVVINGTISAPADWYEGKTQNGYFFGLDQTHVVFSYDAREITLITEDEHSSFGHKITGKLSKNPELKVFAINSNKKFSPKELASLLKMNRVSFQDREQNMRIVKSLNDLRIAVERKIQDTNDFRGNKVASFEQEVKTAIDLTFNLNLPVFTGGEVSTFSVEVNLDVTDAGVTVWLESVDLKEIEDRMAREMMDSVLERLSSLTTIEQ